MPITAGDTILFRFITKAPPNNDPFSAATVTNPSNGVRLTIERASNASVMATVACSSSAKGHYYHYFQTLQGMKPGMYNYRLDSDATYDSVREWQFELKTPDVKL